MSEQSELSWDEPSVEGGPPTRDTRSHDGSSTPESSREGAHAGASRADDMQRFYALAKRQAWKVEQLPWGQIPPVPEGRGSSAKREQRQAMWRSVVTQQLQADLLASQVSVQFLTASPDQEGRLYYSTMAQDEARHAEAWLRMTNAVGGTGEPDPYLDRLGKLTLQLDTIEEKIWLLQVFYEGMVIPRFHQIAAASPGTILADICSRLAVDDGIHHRAGVAYERRLLTNATPATKRAIAAVSKEMWPLFVEHIFWRPRERARASAAMRSRDGAMLEAYLDEGLRIAASLGLEIERPF